MSVGEECARRREERTMSGILVCRSCGRFACQHDVIIGGVAYYVGGPERCDGYVAVAGQ